MKTIKYDKLVRDKIPEIIEKSGKKCVVEVMDKETYILILSIKLDTLTARILKLSSDSHSRIESAPLYSRRYPADR